MSLYSSFVKGVLRWTRAGRRKDQRFRYCLTVIINLRLYMEVTLPATELRRTWAFQSPEFSVGFKFLSALGTIIFCISAVFPVPGSTFQILTFRVSAAHAHERSTLASLIGTDFGLTPAARAAYQDLVKDLRVERLAIIKALLFISTNNCDVQKIDIVVQDT